MPLTRKMLKAMGIEEEEKIEQIMEAHVEVTDALKAQRDEYRSAAERLPAVQRELDELKSREDGGFKEKYEAEHRALEEYKAQVATEKENALKSDMYRRLLLDSGINPAKVDVIMKVTDLQSIGMEDGKLQGVDKLREYIDTEWSDFKVSTETRGAQVDNPTGGGVHEDQPDLGSLSMQDYIAARKKM